MVAINGLMIHVSRGLSGEEVCTLEASTDWDVSDLKWEISERSDVPEMQQRLVTKGRVLMNHELISKAFTGGGTHEVIMIRMDPEWAQTIQDVASGRIRLEEVDASRRQDREVVLAAVRRNGLQLEQASKELRGERDIVLAAVAERGQSLGFAAEPLRGDHEIVLQAVKKDGLAVRHATDRARGDATVGRAAVKQNGWALELLSDELRADRDLVTVAIEQEGQAIKFVSDDLRDDRDLVIKAVKSNAEALRVIAPHHKRDPEVVRAASFGVRMRGFGGLNYFKSLLGSTASLDLSGAM